MMMNDDGGITALVMQCAFAVIAGQKTVTISSVRKKPVGFPRGELLSVGTDGSYNYAVCPVRVLAWIHSKTIKASTTPHSPEASPDDQA